MLWYRTWVQRLLSCRLLGVSMKASPLCWCSLAGSKPCSRAWDKNICKTHHFLTSPLQHLLPNALCTDSSVATATSDLQPNPANTLGAHVLMQTAWGGGRAYDDSLKSMGTARLFKVCKIWPPVNSHYLSHWGTKELNVSAKLHYSTTVRKLTSCGHDYAGIGPCWIWPRFFFYF